MKKIFIISFLLVGTVFHFSACKSEEKKEAVKEESKAVSKKSTAAFSVANANNEINFTAYKTTDKVPVGGQFKKVDVLAGGEGNSVKEAINNTEFSIPVSSLFTKDAGRDYKIKKFFFGIMENTKLLSGKLSLTDVTNGVAEIKMNGITDKVPFEYTITNNVFSMKSTMDINKWNAKAAIASLNKVCEELHKGADGISKTWDEVTLNITSTF